MRQALAAWQSAYAWPAHARLVPARDLHLTLHFVGAIPVERLADVSAAAEVPSPSFELTIDALEVWRGGLAVLTPNRVPDALAALRQTLGVALRQHELPVDERGHKPHVTIGRHCGVPRLLGSEPPGPLAWASSGHVLAARDGPHYRVLRRYGSTLE